MQYTSNLNLKKPESSDAVNIDDLNGNADLLDTAVAGKVDKVAGKGLSTEDYTTAEKSKLAGVAAGAQVNAVTSVAGRTGAVTLSAADVSGVETLSGSQAKVDTHANATTGVHGAVSTATASKIVIRDASGRAQFADPLTAADAATKGYVDAKAGTLQPQIYSLQREVTNLKAVSSLKDRVDGASGLFYDLFDGHNAGSIAQLDTTKTKTNVALSSGNTVLTNRLVNPVGFKLGQEITIQDDVDYERVTINRYEDVITSTTFTRTNVTVAGSANDTSGNGGRKIIILNSGNIYTVARFAGTGTWYIYKSTDNGATWSQFKTVSRSSLTDACLATNGTIVYLLETYGTNPSMFVNFISYDESGNYVINGGTLWENQPYIGNCSLAVAPDGSLHAAWCSKNATYPNSYNIRYSKSTDGGATWASPSYMAGTPLNTSGYDRTFPCLVIKNNNPTVVFLQVLSGQYNINSFVYDGATWGGVYAVSSQVTYAQYNPCVAVAPSGRIWCSWHGVDATDTSQTNIRIKYSDDGGVTWSNGGVSAEKLTSGNNYGQYHSSLSVDKIGNVYVLWHGIDSDVSASVMNVRRIIWNGSSWGSISTLTNNTSGNANFPSTAVNNTLGFTDPLCVYMDAQATVVKFRGNWSTDVTVKHVETTATTKAFKSGSVVARSSAIVSSGKLGFSPGFEQSTTYTRTNVTVVGSAYDTSGNSGRKVTVLSNGWIVAAVKDGSTIVHFYKSEDNGANWAELTQIGGYGINGSFAIASAGKIIYGIYNVDSNTVMSSTFDATTVGSTWSISSLGKTVDIQGGGLGSGCSIALAPDGSLHAAWCSKNATYPNSFNTRYSKSTDGGATWATPTQVTNTNTSGSDRISPCIVITSDGSPVIVANHNVSGSSSQILCTRYRTAFSDWQNTTIHNPGNLTQSNPCAAVAPNGRIWCAWSGKDATDTTTDNIRTKYSDDGGATWTNGGVSAEKLTSGNTHFQVHCSISIDKNENVYVVWCGRTASSATYYQIRRAIWNGTTWGSVTDLTSNTTANAAFASTADNNTLDFTDPLMIYQDTQATAVKFRGSYTTLGVTPVLVEDARYNIIPASNISSIVAWADRETDAGFSLSAAASIHASTESMQSMTKTSATVDGSTSEDQFVLSGVTAAVKGTLRLTLTRSSTGVNKSVKQVLGAGGV